MCDYAPEEPQPTATPLQSRMHKRLSATTRGLCLCVLSNHTRRETKTTAARVIGERLSCRHEESKPRPRRVNKVRGNTSSPDPKQPTNTLPPLYSGLSVAFVSPAIFSLCLSACLHLSISLSLSLSLSLLPSPLSPSCHLPVSASLRQPSLTHSGLPPLAAAPGVASTPAPPPARTLPSPSPCPRCPPPPGAELPRTAAAPESPLYCGSGRGRNGRLSEWLAGWEGAVGGVYGYRQGQGGRRRGTDGWLRWGAQVPKKVFGSVSRSAFLYVCLRLGQYCCTSSSLPPFQPLHSAVGRQSVFCRR